MTADNILNLYQIKIQKLIKNMIDSAAGLK
jgi:hypothetical protein